VSQAVEQLRNENPTLAPRVFDKSHARILRKTHCADWQEHIFDEYVARLEAIQLSPFMDQIKGLQKWNKKDNKHYLQVMMMMDGYRSLAERTGLYGGQGPTLWTNDGNNWFEAWCDKGPPKAARVAVYRHGWKHPVIGVATSAEFRPQSPTGMWAKGGGAHMLSLRAEGVAFRKAFPKELLRRVAGFVGDEILDGEAEEPETIVGPPEEPVSPEEAQRQNRVRKCVELFDAEGVEVEMLDVFLRGDPWAMTAEHVDKLGKIYKHVRQMNQEETGKGLAWFLELLRKRGTPWGPDSQIESNPKAENFGGKDWGPVKCPGCGRSIDRVKFERNGCEHCAIERMHHRDLGAATPPEAQPDGNGHPIVSEDIVEGRDIPVEPEMDPEAIARASEGATEHDLMSESGLRSVSGQLPDPAQNFDEDIPWGDGNSREPGEDG